MPSSVVSSAAPPADLLGGLLKLGRFTSQLASGSNTSLGSGGQ